MTVSLIVPDIAGLHRVHWWGATGGRNNTCAMMGWVKCYQLWGWCWSTHYTALCEENKRPTLWQAAGALATCTKVWCFCALLQRAGFYRLTCALWKTSREILLSAWNLDSCFQENQRYILCCEKHHYSLPDGDGFLRPLFIVSPKKNMKIFWINYRIDFFFI